MHWNRYCVLSLLVCGLSGVADGQSYNQGLTSATVADVSVPASTVQDNSYNVPGEAAAGTPMATSSSVANYGATAYSSVSSSAGAMSAYATAMQPLNGTVNYAEARSQPTIDDFATVTGPEAFGTPVSLTLTMVVSGTYPYPGPDYSYSLAYAGDSLTWTDHTNGTSANGPISGDNASGHTLSPLTTTFNTTIGADIELNYGLDAWVYVAGNSQVGDSLTVSLNLVGLYASGNLAGVTLNSQAGYVYPTPSPSGLATLGVGLGVLCLRRRRRK